MQFATYITLTLKVYIINVMMQRTGQLVLFLC